MDIKDVKRVTIAGCGTEGSQIASMVAYKGFETTVWLRSEGSVERAQPRLASVKKQIVDVLNAWKTGPAAYCRGLSDDRDLTPEQIDELIAQAEERLPKIRLTTSLEEAFGNADVVIECINEDPAQKTDLYEKIAPVMPEHTVLLTDSSTFLPSTFADATGRPDRYLTLHFANQIWRNNLTELMRHDRTSEESFTLAEQFSYAIGMIPLKLNKEQPGYILNTLLIPWFRAALQLVATGVSDPATVDLCWELDTGATKDQTPFRKLDKVGLPLAMHIMGMQPGADDPTTVNGQIVALLKGYVDAGKVGISVGEGFYRYDENGNVIEEHADTRQPRGLHRFQERPRPRRPIVDARPGPFHGDVGERLAAYGEAGYARRETPIASAHTDIRAQPRPGLQICTNETNKQLCSV